jgi:hypothetical protein
LSPNFSGMVARWYIFKPKIPIGVNFGGSCNIICWYILWSILRPFGIFYNHLVYFVVIWYIFPHFCMSYKEKSGNPVLRSMYPMGGYRDVADVAFCFMPGVLHQSMVLVSLAPHLKKHLLFTTINVIQFKLQITTWKIF